MKLIHLLALFTVFGITASKAQEIVHDAAEDHHEHYRNEIGIANSLVYLGNVKDFGYGLHFHYVHYIPHTKFGFGAGYERIFDEHGHNTIGIIGSFRPVEHWGIHLSPGFAFEGTNSDHMGFALHFETTYEFVVGPVHLGPLLEYALDQEDYHISVGVHVGLGF